MTMSIRYALMPFDPLSYVYELHPSEIIYSCIVTMNDDGTSTHQNLSTCLVQLHTHPTSNISAQKQRRLRLDRDHRCMSVSRHGKNRDHRATQ